jgi:hypothetical protein
MLIPGFPNMIFMGAPYSYLVANHATVSEQQVHYSIELLQWMVDEHLDSIEVSREATDAFVEDVEKDLARSTWVNCGNAHGYYRDEGKKVILAIPRHNSRIWQETRSPCTEDFIVHTRADAAPAEQPEMEVLSI